MSSLIQTQSLNLQPENRLMADFFSMGGYGSYVWSAWGLTVVVMAINLILPLRKHRQLRKQMQSGTIL